MIKFVLTLNALDVINLPAYKGSTLRGGFGNAFKTPPSENSEILRKYEKAPHPFIIEPPLEQKRLYNPGETLNFNLILIGKAIDYLPYFIYTFEELGKIGIGKGRGKY